VILLFQPSDPSAASIDVNGGSMDYTADKMNETMRKQLVVEQAEKAMELREELEKVGRWAIVTWNDEDLREALFEAGLPVTEESVIRLRNYVKDEIEVHVTAAGVDYIAEGIDHVREVMFPNMAEETV
jgi:hypothetical protein